MLLVAVLVVAAAATAHANAATATLPTLTYPYPALTGGSFSGPAAPLSPDPLVRYRWPAELVNETAMQTAAVLPDRAEALPPSAFNSTASLTTSASGRAWHMPGCSGRLRLRYAAELAGVFELWSDDLRPAVLAYEQAEAARQRQWQSGSAAALNMSGVWFGLHADGTVDSRPISVHEDANGALAVTCDCEWHSASGQMASSTGAFVLVGPAPFGTQHGQLSPNGTRAVLEGSGGQHNTWCRYPSCTPSGGGGVPPGLTVSLGEGLVPQLNKNSMLLTPYAPPAGADRSTSTSTSTSTTVFRLDASANQRDPDNKYNGIRFIFVDIAENTPAAQIGFSLYNASVVAQVRPVNYVGRFSSSDAQLERIWWVGAYAVRVTQRPKNVLASELLDRGDRENCNSGGYQQPVVATLQTVFDDAAFVHGLNRQTATWQHDSDIESYWLYWIDTVADTLAATGNHSAAAALLGGVDSRLAHAEDVQQACVEQREALRFFGDDERVGYQFLVDTYPTGMEYAARNETCRSFGVLLIGSLGRAATMLRALNETARAAIYEAKRQQYIAALRSGGAWWAGWGVHASADAISAGFASASEVEALVGNMLPAARGGLTLTSWSAFNGWYIVRALAAANRTAEALPAVRAMWGAMADLGATCTWERFDIEWRRFMQQDQPPWAGMGSIMSSSCHPWSAGSTQWLTANILGVRRSVVDGRAGEWLVAQGAVAAEEVSGDVPVGGGQVLRVAWQAWGRRVRVEVPGGWRGPGRRLAVRVGLRMEVLGEGEEKLVGMRVVARRGGGEAEAARVVPVFVENGWLWMEEVLDSAGVYDVEAELFGAASGGKSAILLSPPPSPPPPSPPPPPASQYLGRVVGVDETTHGAWRGRYGQDGYVLFGQEPGCAGGDVAQLPAYVAGLDVLRGSSGKAVPRMVAACNATGDKRALGAVAGSLVGPDTSFFLDVRLAGERRPMNLTLYFVDWARAGDLRMLVRAMAGGDGLGGAEPLSIVAPMVMVDEAQTQGGVYVQIETVGSARLRIYQTWSEMDYSRQKPQPASPQLVALFFD